MHKKFRRVVTRHDEKGKSCIIFDSYATNVRVPENEPKVAMTDLWYSYETPASNDGNADAADREIVLHPPRNGSVLRIVELPPDNERNFSNLKSVDDSKSAVHEGQRHPGFHKTDTLDYIIVMEGELYAMMEEGETLLQTGDVLIQRGTLHAWSNRSTKRAIIAGIMFPAKPVS